MGYSYDASGRLCCDVCDKSGGVRKYRCPFGYCPAIALCPTCKETHPHYISKKAHREQGCEEQSRLFDQHEQEKNQLIASGKFVRCAALKHYIAGIDRDKVIFRGKDGAEQAYWMSPETYKAIPWFENATPEDYMKHGEVQQAANTDIYDSEELVAV